jgi:opacity protein-like surface antigen
MKARAVLTATLSGLALLAPLLASAQTADDRWTFSIMPYLWVPSVDGKLKYGRSLLGGATANVNVDASSLLDNLDFAFMINGEARKGRWLIATDVIYLDFSKSDSTVRSVDSNLGSGPIDVSAFNSGTQSSLWGWVWTLVGGYALVPEKTASLDLIGGFRYLTVRAKTDWQLTAAVNLPSSTLILPRSGSVEKSEDLWSAIVGAKGRVKLGQSDWFVDYYADIGGASSNFTWQGAAGIGYAFKWGDIIFDYRYLYYSESGDKLIDNVSFGGFALGANFRF